MVDPERAVFEDLFHDSRVNALLAWGVVGAFVVVFVGTALQRDVPWLLFTTITGAIALVPPASRRSWQVMLPWELLVLGSLPVIVRAVEISVLASTFATYLSLAALALIITVELHVLSRVQVTHLFAVSFVSLATLAVGGAWAIVRWNVDRLLGTSFLSTNGALMVEFLWVLAAGIAAGILFDLYFRQRSRQLRQTLGRVVRR